jgi:hypothetical protein
MAEARPLAPSLSKYERAWSGVLGLVFAVSAGLLLFWPPQRVVKELDGGGATIGSTVADADVVAATTVLLIVGMAFLAIAVNGLRLARFSAGGLTAEAMNATERAKEFYSHADEDVESLQIDGSQPEGVATLTHAPSGTVASSQGELSIYELRDVPMHVIRDALRSWPDGHQLPGSVAEFEFASRKKGKGNHPWALKFKNTPPIVVSYGGQGKTDATVQEAPGAT